MTAEGDVLVERVRVCLAEAGWPDAEVWEGPQRRWDGKPEVWAPFRGVPEAVWWMAGTLAYGGGDPCWSCWWGNSRSAERHNACSAGDCQAAPDEPRRPPRELLLRRDG